MSEPASTTWLGLSPAVLLATATALGAVLAKGIGALWKVVTGREAQTVLREQLAVERAEKERLSTLVEKLGMQKDELRSVLERERLRAAGVVYRVHQDSRVDDALVEDMPTAVHERAKLLSGADPHASWGADPHPDKEWDPMQSTPPGAHKGRK
jgi:hypothetical protein